MQAIGQDWSSCASWIVHGLPGLDRLILTTTPAILPVVVVLAAVVPLRRAGRESDVALRAE